MVRFEGKYKDLGYIVENGQILSTYKIFDFGFVTKRKIEIANGSSANHYTEQNMKEVIDDILKGRK